MPQSLTIQLTHLVFSTQDRRPWVDPHLQPPLFALMAAALKTHQCTPVVVNGMPDHLHILFSLGPTKSLSDVVREIKTSTSRWMKKQGDEYAAFAWQRGYAAFSVSPSNRAQVERYVQAQHEHHARLSFQDELRALLHKHGLEFDERYLWD